MPRALSSDGSRADCFGRYVIDAGSSVRISEPDRLVEALPGFFADPAALDQRIDERRQRERLGASRRRQALDEIARDVSEHVEAGDVHRAKRRALRPPERGPVIASISSIVN